MGNSTLDLSSHFPESDESEWLALVQSALKGKSVDSLNIKTYDDIYIKPLYRETDWASASDLSGFPAQFPFTRGFHTSKPDGRPWDIRQIIATPDLDAAKQDLLHDLQHGVSSIELRIDANAEAGVPIKCVADLERLLSSVHLDWAPIGVENCGHSSGADLEIAALLCAYSKEKYQNTNELEFSFNVDPLGALARTGTLHAPISSTFDTLTDFFETAHTVFPRATLIRVDSRPVHEAGGSEAQELAVLIGSAVTYLREFQKRKVELEQVAKRMLFTVSVGADYVVEIAKIRAARVLWSNVLKHFEIDEAKASMKLQSVSSRRMLTKYDPWGNILRNSAACFASGVGGADIVTVRPFTDAIGHPNKLARRIARNTHIIAQEEAGLGKVIDASGGAWCLETLTHDIAKKAWRLFQGIESQGGYVDALKNKTIHEKVSKVRSKRFKDIAHRRYQITGISDFPNLNEKPIDLPNYPVAPQQLVEDKLLPQHSTFKDKVSQAKAGAKMSSELDAQSHLTVDPLWPIRFATPYESLRDHAKNIPPSNTKSSKVFLAALGNLSEHTARTSFATNFFAAGGLEVEYYAGSLSEIQSAFKKSECLLACICGSDQQYLSHAADMARALGEAGVLRLYLAGRAPEDIEYAWKEAGIDEFIHQGVDVIASLELAHTELGISK